MTEPRLETPRYWEAQSGVKIIDPDGWRPPYEKSFSEPITRAEFIERAMRCTIDGLSKLQGLMLDDIT